MQAKAFITGSRAYGTPREDSDVDLVILTDKPTRDALIEIFGRGRFNYDGTSTEIESGKLHLICCTTEKDFEAWRKGTEVLVEVAPVTTEQATRALSRMRAGFC